MSDFSSKLEYLRRKRGLTVRNLASALGVGVGTVGGWLKKNRPRPAVAAQLADYFGVTVEALLNEEPLPGGEAAEAPPVAREAPAVSPSGVGGGQAELLVELRLLRAEVAALRQEQQQLQLALAQSDRARRAG